MSSSEEHANIDAGGDRYRAIIPTDWAASKEERFRRYLAEKVPRIETARNLALYGTGLSQHYATGRYPQNATNLNDHTGGNIATDVLGRSSWGAPELSLECAADAIEHGPDLILATSATTSFPRATNFRIYAASALYADEGAIPLGMRRSFGGDDDRRADEAIAQLVNATTTVATSGRCTAPLAACELGFADDLINRLAGDTYPFVAAIGPDWFHPHISHNMPWRLLSKSPFELFVAHDNRDYLYTRPSQGGGQTCLIPMQYLEQEAGLFYVLVRDRPLPYFLVRPPTPSAAGIHQQMSAAADLAVQVAGLHNVRPLDDLGLEAFFASETADMRWLRHMTIVQAVVTFSVIDPFTDGPSLS